jgi:hypothetical protein
MPTKKFEILVNGQVLFTKFTQSESTRLSNLLNNKNIKHEIKITSFL